MSDQAEAQAAAQTDAKTDQSEAVGIRLTALDITAMAAAVVWHAALILTCAHYAGVDAFFHVAESRSLLSEGLFAGVTTLPFTVLGSHGTDHHFLFHVLGLPFAFLPDFQAIRYTAVFFAVLSTTGFILWMRRQRVPKPWLWALLLIAASEVYNFRMSLLRSQTVDVPLLLFAMAFVMAGRHRAAAVLAFVFSWSHHGATILAPVAVLCIIAARFGHGTSERKVLRPAAWLVGGFVLGQVVNPWFPDNLEYLFFHAMFKTANPLNLPLGGEWLPARPGYILTELWPAHALLLLFTAALARRLWTQARRPAADTLAMALVWLMFLVLTLKHGRFIGFLVPVQVALIALMGRDLAPLNRRIVAVIALVCSVMLVPRFMAVQRLIDDGAGPQDYVSTAKYLADHTEPGEVVFNVRWDQYPLLTLASPRNRFVIGLDPNYLAYGSPKHFQVWNNLRAGARHVPELGARISGLFGAKLVVATHEEAALLARYKELKLVHTAPRVMIWRINTGANRPAQSKP